MEKAVRLSPRSLVVSLDIGTHGSGFAYATKPTISTRSLVKLHELWPDQRVSYCKTRSALLYQDRSPVAWGDSALQKLYEMEASGQDMSQYHLVESFKLALHEPGLAALLPQGLRPEMVMADYLTFMRKYALNELAANVGNAAARLDNIQWCLTVPAMWSEGNKALMRRASFIAGLIKKADSDAMTIILEPEAAALHALDKQAPPLVAGMSVMVLDVGGGTADATVHNCQALGGQVVLSEATCAEGALCGSVYVDKEFRSFYRKAVGEAVFDKWAKDDRASLQQVMQEWEKIKCSYASNHASGLAQSLGQLNLGASEPNSTFTVPIPPKLASLMPQPGPARVTLNGADMESFFQGPVNAVCDLAVRQLQAAQQQGRADPCSMVLLVGGFARSSYLQARVRAAVLGSGLADQVVVPPAPHTAVLGGAVLYGDNPSLIHARRSRMAYGVRSCCPYVPGAPGKFFHLEDKCWYTNSLFVPYVERNEMVARDHEVVHELQPLYRSSDEVQLQLYATDESNTTWVDDDKMGQSVQQLCKLRTALPSYATNADRTIHLRFRFGQTEITATAWNNATGDRMETSITFAQA